MSALQVFDPIPKLDFVRLEVVEPIIVEPKRGAPTILVLSLRLHHSGRLKVPLLVVGNHGARSNIGL